ncbi:1052_t:CDS:2, partial [Funneliformis geosporum]
LYKYYEKSGKTRLKATLLDPRLKGMYFEYLDKYCQNAIDVLRQKYEELKNIFDSESHDKDHMILNKLMN